MPSMLTLVNGMAIAALDELFAVDLTNPLAKMKPEQQSLGYPDCPFTICGSEMALFARTAREEEKPDKADRHRDAKHTDASLAL